MDHEKPRSYSRGLIEWAFREWYEDYLLHPERYQMPNLNPPDVLEEADAIARTVTDHLVCLMDTLKES
jgi:hypothetical protein